MSRRPAGEVLRAFDVLQEDMGRLVRLKEAIYDRPLDREAFAWEYLGHPRAREIRVFVCEREGELIAATTRLPATLLLAGAPHPLFFNVESMVHPAHRRRGRMRELYTFARSQLPGPPLMFSKGSSDRIYPMLLGIGQRPILPNTFLVSRPSTLRWLLSRLHLRGARAHQAHAAQGRALGELPLGFRDVVPITRFGPTFDAFFGRVCGKFSGILARDAAFMNWRYVDVPHRRYASFMRVTGGEITSVVVLAMREDKGSIVDLVWDPDRADEPERAVRFAQAWLGDRGAANVLCFATHPPLRATLAACGFVDRGQTPRFTAFVPPGLEGALASPGGLHVVDGDGDTEFS